MHEIFLTATVQPENVETVRAILQGYCEGGERQRVTLVRHLHRRDESSGMIANIKGLPTIKELQKEKGPNTALWQELHQSLAKQSYILQTRYDVTEEFSNAQAGDPRAVGAAGKKPVVGTLRWNDQCDPPSNRYPPFVTQRRCLEIRDKNLELILAANKFTLKSESVEESCTWWCDGEEYSLVRYLTFSPELSATGEPQLQQTVPVWLLFIRMQVESNLERMQQAYATLSRIREKLFRVPQIQFKVFDRRAHDTRDIGAYRSSVVPA
ncbi:hypothetical protein QBC46DRAFT_165253 [Diplogelasinospora grovesii]|uniref:Mediator of RNA polymerase II transcription subunit 18 n=1 Tax=Diplogelasinospora grovesii TaxID=303347 RepID=A0AAN6NG13_9PEZI|nr:hypothetical protein QBC46DRAFT_165253 [Diplogelasinospora grovesii]